MGLADSVTGAILVWCRARPDVQVLANPVGWGWFKCVYCGTIFRGIEDA